MKFVTINNCEGCHKAPCHKIWNSGQEAEEAKKIVQTDFACINQDMSLSAALEVATFARSVELPFVFEVKQAKTEQHGVFDFYIPNRFLNTESHKLANILMITQSVQTGISRVNERTKNEIEFEVEFE